MGFLTPEKKLDILQKSHTLRADFIALGTDTGRWRGSDTGAALGSGRVHSAKLAAILSANGNYALEGWYISAKANLVAMGETVT